VQRAIFYLRLFPGTEAEYDRRHAAIWPDVSAEIRESGLRNMSGFRRGTDVWCYLEAEPDTTTAFAKHGPKPANQRWSHYLRDVIAQITDDTGELVWYDEVFHADGPPLDGPYERRLLSLVIDLERSAEYDALHADPWPDMIAAIVGTGFRNYSGFRRGPHVVYYGEFYPDLATVSGRMAGMEVNARWGAALGGIITTAIDASGQPIIADEVFHRD
jgi:L-rhamnose mutarotase